MPCAVGAQGDTGAQGANGTSSVTVTQTNYGGTDPITESGSTITIGTASNAYGRKTVSTSNPSGGNNGDIWYKV